MRIAKSAPSRSTLFTVLAIAFLTSSANGQTDLSKSQGTGCSASKSGSCNRPAFLKAFAVAKTVSVGTRPDDEMAAGQITTMLNGMGKVPAPAGTPGDLAFVLEKVNTEGVFVGPGGTELAILRVYSPATEGGRNNLIWVEAYSGQLDVTWPVAVRGLVRQFQARVGNH
jgi:hypothetical protein